jgi:hypothetical protein
MNYLTLRHNHRRGGDPWPFSLSENRRFDLGGKIRCCKSVYQFTRFELYFNKWKRRVEILIGIRSLNTFPSYLRFVIMPIINFHFNLFHCNRIFRLIFHSCPMQSRRFHRGFLLRPFRHLETGPDSPLLHLFSTIYDLNPTEDPSLSIYSNGGFIYNQIHFINHHPHVVC